MHKYKPRYDFQNKMSWNSDLKYLPTSCLRYKSEGKSPKFLIAKMRLPVRVLEKMLKAFWANDWFSKIFLSIYLEKFTHSFQSFTKNFSNLAYFAHIWNISDISCHNMSLKLNLLFISKFRFDWVHGKMLNNTHLGAFNYYACT